jgi:hypothetical protein
MKMQVITISPQKYGVHEGIRIKRKLFDNCGLVDMAFCSIRFVKNGFAASGFSSIYKPTIIHAVSNSSESIDDFIKEVFSK